MYEELIIETPAGEKRQSEIIRQYCSGVEERIDDAPSREEAQRIIDETCVRLEQTCESELLRSFLRSILQAHIAQRWR